MVPYKLIGLSGKAGCGKDYITSRYLQPYGYQKLSFAWLLKWAAIAQGRCTWEEAFVTKPEPVRHILQQMGTDEWRKDYGGDVWVRGLDAIARTMVTDWGVSKFVVADVRFKNEVDAVLSLGECYRIHAPERVKASPLTPEQRLHKSEIDLDNVPDSKFTGIIMNDPEYSATVGTQIERIVGLAQIPLL